MDRAVLAIVGLVALVGCDDPVEPEPVEEGPYEVTTLRTLQEGAEATFGDLNENGQALWTEGDQSVLWDNGNIVELPVVARGLGSSGEVYGSSSLWKDGQLIDLPGRPRGILEDGTIYLLRNDTLFTWRDGVLEATDRPVGPDSLVHRMLVGPEGRIWVTKKNADAVSLNEEEFCGFYEDGTWHLAHIGFACDVRMAEENGWALAFVTGGSPVGVKVLGPGGYWIHGEVALSYHDAVHVNEHGHAIAENGLLVLDHDGTDPLDLTEHFEDSLRLGAINDDGDILAQLDNRVVLLTPR